MKLFFKVVITNLNSSPHGVLVDFVSMNINKSPLVTRQAINHILPYNLEKYAHFKHN